MSHAVKSSITSPAKQHATTSLGRDLGELSQRPVTELEYILGHSQREIRRLTAQAAILQPITKRLMQNVKLAQGMQVLDLGCGAGDVAMLAAEIVGPTGLVVGIDRNKDVLDVATERARTARFPQIRFEQASVETFRSDEAFDLVIARYVLMHQFDPVEFVRTAARLVKRGGTIAFHEIRLNELFDSSPRVPLWQLAGTLIETACQFALPHHDIADRLIECFSEAGLPHPCLFCDTPIGGGVDSPFYAWVAETVKSFHPQLAKMGIAASGFDDIETLESSLRAAVVKARSQIVAPGQVCAWAKV